VTWCNAGSELENLIKNPTLSGLLGGIESVTLGDEEARRRGVQKSVLERAGPPTFDVAVSWQAVCQRQPRVGHCAMITLHPASASPPAIVLFGAACMQVEMVDRTHWRVHRDVAAAVDRLLLNQEAGDELRTVDAAGKVVVVPDAEDDLPSASQPSAERCGTATRLSPHPKMIRVCGP
jgi:hypothetical protein